MNDPYLTTQTVLFLLPELLLLGLATLVYVGGAFLPDRAIWNLATFVGLCAVAYTLWKQPLGWNSPQHLVDGPLFVDSLAQCGRWLALLVGFIFVLASTHAADDSLTTEYLGSLLLLIAGLMLVCSAGDLVLLFLGLELISIPTYILLFLGRRNAASHEATTKYFFLSILSSAILLYGFSFLYGIAGTTDLDPMPARLAEVGTTGLGGLLPLAMLLIFGGLAFKIAAVPFHFYAADVYQGTTAGNAGVLAVVPKIAGVVVLVRLIAVAMPTSAQFAWQVIMGVSIVTMTLGNTLALWQQNIRRLMAYSSIAHAGYLLIGLAVALAIASGGETTGRAEGLSAMLFYLVVYSLATSGIFAALAYLASRERDVETVDDLAGLGRTYPLIASALALFLLSLAGLPPLAGFWGKFTLFLSALDVDVVSGSPLRTWFLVLAVAAGLNAAIAAAYYLRVIAAMFFRESITVPHGEGGFGAWLATTGAAVLVIGASLFAGPLIRSSNTASRAARAVHQPVRPRAVEAANVGEDSSPAEQAANAVAPPLAAR